MADKQKKGLGTGLSALFGEDMLDDGQEGELLNLPIAKIEPRAEQPRNRFDEAALQELADSIARYGLIQPITVRKLESGYYQIIAGERRWRAARIAGLIELPVRVINADDRRTAELALVENLQREDLSPIEEALGYKTLIEEYGLTQEEAAKSVGRSRPAVTNALRLLNLSPSVIRLLEDGEISAGHARAIVALPTERLQLEAADKVAKSGLNVRKTEQLVNRMLSELSRPEKEPGDAVFVDYIADTSDYLSRVLARRVKFETGKKGGKIVLEYYDNDDREALIKNLARMGDSWEEHK